MPGRIMLHAMHKHDWGDFHYRITGKNEKESYSWKVVGRITVLWESIMKTGWWRISLKNWMLRENGTMIKERLVVLLSLPDEKINELTFETRNLKT